MSKFYLKADTLDAVQSTFRDMQAALYSLNEENLAPKGVTASKLNLPWTDWTPIFSASGAMTFTVTQTYRAKYRQIDNVVEILMAIVGTTGGVAGNTIYFTIPVDRTGDYLFFPFTCFVLDPSTLISGVAYLASNYQIGVRKYDASNWGIGVGRDIAVHGFYILE